MKTFTLEYDSYNLAVVEIDEAEAAEPIKEMVEFWMGWEGDLEENNGDYTRTWLKLLAKFILTQRDIPRETEGWVPLNGTNGIRIISWGSWDPDVDQIEISELSREARS